LTVFKNNIKNKLIDHYFSTYCTPLASNISTAQLRQLSRLRDGKCLWFNIPIVIMTVGLVWFVAKKRKRLSETA